MPFLPSLQLGFGASALARLTAGLAIVGLAGGLFLVVERELPPVEAVQKSTLPAATASARRVRIESTFAVAHWSVQMAGQDVAAVFSDNTTWQGAVDAPQGTEILIEARAPEGVHHHTALRIEMDNDPLGVRMVWSDGDVVATVRIP